MTYEEAHKYLENLQREFTRHRKAYAEELIYANGIAILAIEKQIPKKPKKLHLCCEYYSTVCSICGYEVDDYFIYCPECGQALDWS